MIETRMTLPELGLIAVTRGMAGAGIGLLLANHLSPEQRTAVGRTLLLVGLITTIPLALEVLNSARLSTSAGTEENAQRGSRLAEQSLQEAGSFARR
jgi:hypothetical protein